MTYIRHPGKYRISSVKCFFSFLSVGFVCDQRCTGITVKRYFSLQGILC